jgi:hypothetical protein
MVSEIVADALRAVGVVESETVIETEVVPEVLAAGVPEMVPVAAEMTRPEGRVAAEKA